MLAQDTEIIEIDNEQAYEAKVLASALSTEQSRKRAMIDYLGINCAKQYLTFKKLKVDNKRSVYKIPFLFEEFKISDLYYGNYRIDVITLFKEKTIKIPKIHMDMEILPNFYLIIQIGSRIKEAKIVGFIDSKNIYNCSHDSKFYYPTLDMIFGIERFYSVIKRSIPSKTMLGKHVDCIGMFLKFIDNDLSSVYKRQLIQHLMNCDSCRARFIDTMDFENLARNIRHYPQLIKKYENKDKVENTMLQNELYKNDISLEEAIKSKDKQTEEKNEQEGFFDIPTQKTNNIGTLYPKGTDKTNELKTVQMFDIPSSEKSQVTKKIINAIFNEIPKMELPAIKTIMQSKNRRIILAAISVFFILGSFALISMSSVNDAVEEKKQMEAVEEYNSNDYPLEYDLPQSDNKTFDEYTIKQPVSTKPTYSPTISKVSWEASKELVQKDTFSKYLMMSGKNIKLNLQNELLLINDVPTNGQAMIEVVLAKNGNVLNVDLIQSSGSRMVDDAIKKVVTDTLRNMKPPSLNTNEPESSIVLKLILN